MKSVTVRDDKGKIVSKKVEDDNTKLSKMIAEELKKGM